MSKVNPNMISVVSLLFAALSALLYILEGSYFLLLAAIMVLVSGFFDALDGKVARISSKASKRGDFVDHVIDRYSDAIILGAIAISARCEMSFGLFAVIGVLLTSYMGTQAQALGLGREYKGILGRADRILVLVVFSLIQFAFEVADSGLASDILGYSIISWMMVLSLIHI